MITDPLFNAPCSLCGHLLTRKQIRNSEVVSLRKTLMRDYMAVMGDGFICLFIADFMGGNVIFFDQVSLINTFSCVAVSFVLSGACKTKILLLPYL